ncbi:MAG: CAP domain-containing protein, partial [Gemmatimonadota bacterium]|nr:CAP domain-containing protein [Gemmatimonadota bacterium]
MTPIRFFLMMALLASSQQLIGQVAPPPAMAPVTVPEVPSPKGSNLAAATALQLYSIGSPTNDEQMYLEYINRARANPVAEAARLAATTDVDVLGAYRSFGVNLVLMQSQFVLLQPMPPLSINPLLTDAARAHSQDMLAKSYQGHTGSDGSSPATRNQPYLTGANGYGFAENVYAYSKSVFYGHAGFEVDWGGSAAAGGMQVPAGHRLNIHGNYREIGVGVVSGSNGSVGPQ